MGTASGVCVNQSAKLTVNVGAKSVWLSPFSLIQNRVVRLHMDFIPRQAACVHGQRLRLDVHIAPDTAFKVRDLSYFAPNIQHDRLGCLAMLGDRIVQRKGFGVAFQKSCQHLRELLGYKVALLQRWAQQVDLIQSNL